MSNKHQTTDTGSSENTNGINTHPSKTKGKENHTEAHQVQKTENL